MPKISAPTVAEHRAVQRAALVRAGGEVLVESGLAGVSAGTVCERTGMSRSSFYGYFPSKDDLLVAIALDAIEQWDAELERTLAGAEPGIDELQAFVDATMAMTADGRHEIAGALRDARLSPSRMDDLMKLHDALLRPLVRVLGDLGVPSPATAALLVQGVLGAGMEMVSHGEDPRSVAREVFRLVSRGVVG